MNITKKSIASTVVALFISTSIFASDSIFPQYTGVQVTSKSDNIDVTNYPSGYGKVIANTSSDNIYIVGQNDDWYKVRVADKEGWTKKSNIEVSDNAFIPHTKVKGEEIVEYAKQFIGTPYVWGGNDLLHGVDCSGLTKQVYEGFEINISRVSYAQVNDGKRVEKSELKPGDLVFFDTSGVNQGNISHVGIYAGDGKFLHADSDKGVTISSLSSDYYTRNYVSSSRILDND